MFWKLWNFFSQDFAIFLNYFVLKILKIIDHNKFDEKCSFVWYYSQLNQICVSKDSLKMKKKSFFILFFHKKNVIKKFPHPALKPRTLLNLIPLANWLSGITGSVSESGSQKFQNIAHLLGQFFLLPFLVSYFVQFSK